MFVITQHFRKAGEEGAFYNFSDSYKSHIQTTYRDTSKLLSTEVTFNAIDKVLITVNRWSNEADYNSYKEDPVVVQALAERESYNTANAINMSFRGTHEETDPV